MKELEELQSLVNISLELRPKKKDAKADMEAAGKDLAAAKARVDTAAVRSLLLVTCISHPLNILSTALLICARAYGRMSKAMGLPPFIEAMGMHADPSQRCHHLKLQTMLTSDLGSSCR